jgi:hypothetical protein
MCGVVPELPLCLHFMVHKNTENFTLLFAVTYSKQQGPGVTQPSECLTTDWTNGVRNPAEAKDFTLVSVFRSALRPTQSPIQRVLGGGVSFPRG